MLYSPEGAHKQPKWTDMYTLGVYINELAQILKIGH